MSRLTILAAALVTAAVLVMAPAGAASARPWGPYGHWVHGWHYGRYGWWWTGPGFWYWYPAPVYYNYNYASPPPPDSALAPETSPTWYYCDSAKAYFPYVGSCAVPWRAVPATAPSKDGGTPPAPPSPTKS